MKVNRIGLKLGVVIMALFLIVLISLGLVMDRVFTSFYHAKTQEDAEELATHFANMAKSHRTGSEEMIHAFAEFSNVGIYLADLSEKRMVHLGNKEMTDDTFYSDSDFELLAQGNSLSYVYEAAGGEHFFVSAKPIPEEGAALYVLSSMTGMEESLDHVRGLMILSAVGAFFLALGFTNIVSQVLSRPLVQMEQATRKIAKGDFGVRLQVRSEDEIGALAAAINGMARDLQHYQETRQEFLSNISHELRTPITYLEGYAKVLSDGLYETEEERKQYLAIIRQESLRLNRLIHDLFELSKMEEGKVGLTMEWVDLQEIVGNCVQKVRLKAKDKGIRLLSQSEEHVPMVYADGLRTEQIILNLLENAIRYTEQGAVQVRLLRDGDMNQVIVEDTGIGIPADELPYIFERFYRVEKSRSRQYGGTGLGLSIAKKLVELQGGTIDVYSQVGAGTRVVLTFLAEGSSDGEK